MSCCGSRRAAWRSDDDLAPRRPTHAPGNAPAVRETHLRVSASAKRGGATLYLRGPSSGRAYRFTAEVGTAVDAVDAEALLRTGRLERA